MDRSTFITPINMTITARESVLSDFQYRKGNAKLAFFLDLDGSTGECPFPNAPVKVVATILAAAAILIPKGHRFAWISGRNPNAIQKALLPLKSCFIGGQHGVICTHPDGSIKPIIKLPDTSAEKIRVKAFVDQNEPLKYSALDAGYIEVVCTDRTDLAEHVRMLMQAIVDGRPHDFQLLEMKGPTFEIIPKKGGKHGAVDFFLDKNPSFQGCVPVAVGDDVNDIPMFRKVTQRGGLAIQVGDNLALSDHVHFRVASPEKMGRLFQSFATASVSSSDVTSDTI